MKLSLEIHFIRIFKKYIFISVSVGVQVPLEARRGCLIPGSRVQEDVSMGAGN